MAYNGYFTAPYYNPYAFQPQPPQPMMQMQGQAQTQQGQQSQQPQAPTIQQSGFVLVQSEQEARSYPVAPGNSITFKDESKPYCYVKTMGFSQLDRPTFERYRLIKEEAQETASETTTTGVAANKGMDTQYALKSDLDALWREIEALKGKAATKAKKAAPVEVDDDDD